MRTGRGGKATSRTSVWPHEIYAVSIDIDIIPPVAGMGELPPGSSLPQRCTPKH